MRGFFGAPIADYLDALDGSLTPFSVARLVAALAGFAAGWFIYVPLHELLHAFGCLATGGSVTRLEIDAVYGAAWLQRVFPFVAVGSEYAGQLTGFDTHGNDLIYLATDATPFLLTLFVGVPMLRSAGRREAAWLRACLSFGAAIPVAYAPFISLTGDYYEMGSIIVSRAVWLLQPGFDVARWRSDDLFKLLRQLSPTASVGDLVGIAIAAVVGMAMAFATYAAGRRLARLMQRAVATTPEAAPGGGSV
jgi:hypothetical protein